MGKHEKAPQVIGVPQFAELAACVLKQLPRDIDSGIAQQWIKEPKALSKVLKNALCPPSLVLERVRVSGYLDVSFDGKEVHPLVIRPLTKKQAFAEYRNSGGETWVRDELENSAPYVVQETKLLNVMILNFGDLPINGASIEIDNLGVRPLIYEELIQYGIMYSEHQKRKHLIGLGTRHWFHLCFFVPILYLDGSGRSLGISKCPDCEGARLCRKYRFLVVPK